MMNLTKYHSWLFVYVVASIFAQFLVSTPIELFTIFGVTIWIPLSAITLVPLVDVLRSFTQNQAEKESRTFKRVGSEMMFWTLSTSAVCVIFAGLPLPIFTGVLLAVMFGGAVDILVFRRMGKYFTSPVKRMIFSNGSATLLGSGIVFFVAFTDIIFAGNPMAKPYLDVVVGWLTQSVVIWAAGITIAMITNRVLESKR